MSRRAFWSVRDQFMVAFVAMALVPLAVYATTTYSLTRSSLARVERDEIRDTATGVQNALMDKAISASQLTESVARRPLLYTSMKRGDVAWIRENVTKALPSYTSENMVQILNLNGTSIATAGPSLSGLRGKDEIGRALAGTATADLEVINGRLYVIGAAPITPEPGTTPSAGVVVLGQEVNDAMLAGISTFTGASASLALFTNGFVTAATGASVPAPMTSFNPDPGEIGAVATHGDLTSEIIGLRDRDHTVVSLLRVSLPRQTFTGALAHMASAAIITFAGAIVLALFVGLLSAEAISRPLRRLAQAAAAMSRGEFRQLVKVRRRDEIGQVTEAFNGMSEQVAQRIEELSSKSQTLSLGIADLRTMGSTLAQADDLRAEQAHLAEMTRSMFQSSYAALYIADGDDDLQPVGYAGEASRPPAADELAAASVACRATIESEDVSRDVRLSAAARRGPHAAPALIAAPMTRHEGVAGAVVIGYPTTSEIWPEDVALLSSIAIQIGVGLQNSESYAQLDRMYLETVTALAAAMEAKDQYTADHADSLAAMAVGLGRQLGLSGDELRTLQFAAVLHDIGKIGVPGVILNKPDRLTPDEFAIMAQHTIIGERIISRIENLRPVARIIRSMHERWDGGGYPDGLVGEQIPLAARIVFVCDAFHAMTSDRPYRRALPVDEAIEELRRNTGRQFDPLVMDAFLAVSPFAETPVAT